jgi:hypothetical protein
MLSQVYMETIRELETALAETPRRLILEFVGTQALCPDMALILHELMVDRPPQTEIVTHARSGLVNASVLPWILGDKRVMRRTGWIYFNLPKVQKPDDRPEADWCDGEWSDSEDFGFFHPPNHHTADMEQVGRIINQYLPLDEIAGKRLGVEDLKQFGLLGDNPIDSVLESNPGRKITGSECSQ